MQICLLVSVLKVLPDPGRFEKVPIMISFTRTKRPMYVEVLAEVD